GNPPARRPSLPRGVHPGLVPARPGGAGRHRAARRGGAGGRPAGGGGAACPGRGRGGRGAPPPPPPRPRPAPPRGGPSPPSARRLRALERRVRGHAPPERHAGRRVRRALEPPAGAAEADRHRPHGHEPRRVRSTLVTVVALRVSRLVWADAPVLRWLAASRLVVFGVFLLLFAVGPVDAVGPHFYEWPLQLLGAWDGVWYARVAAHGYLLIPGRQSDPAFFPFDPILMRALHTLGLPLVAAGALIANAAFLVAVPAFHRLGRRLLPERVALRGAVFLAIAPMGYVFSMAYPESLLLLFCVFALLAALDGRWGAAAVLAGLAALTRPEGAVLLAVVLGGIAWRSWGSLDSAGRGRAVAAVAAAPAALLAFMGYLQWALGDMRAWSRAEQPWGRSFGLDGPLRAAEHLPRLISTEPVLTRDAALLALGIAPLALAATRTALPREWIVAGALVIVLPIFSGTVESAGRFCLMALPCYWGAGALELSRRAEQAVPAGCLLALAPGVVSVPFFWP